MYACIHLDNIHIHILRVYSVCVCMCIFIYQNSNFGSILYFFHFIKLFICFLFPFFLHFYFVLL